MNEAPLPELSPLAERCILWMIELEKGPNRLALQSGALLWKQAERDEIADDYVEWAAAMFELIHAGYIKGSPNN